MRVLLQQARSLERSEGFGEHRQRRVVMEHRLARLVQLGIRQSRYFGRAKTKFQLYFQLYLEATVANLTLVADKADLAAGTVGGFQRRQRPPRRVYPFRPRAARQKV